MRALVVGSDVDAVTVAQNLGWKDHIVVATDDCDLLGEAGRMDVALVAPAAAKGVARWLAQQGTEGLDCPIVFLPPNTDDLGATAMAAQAAGGRLRVGDLTINLNRSEVRRSGRRLSLTKCEFNLLVALAQNEGRTLSRKEIQIAVWGDDTRSLNAVDAHVTNLRRKLDRSFGEPLIHTVFGVGYALIAPEEL